MRLFYDKHNEDENVVKDVAIKCIKCYRSTGLFLRDKPFKTIITKLMLNTVLCHMGFSRIIYSNKKMKYDTEENNYPNWLNKGPWYNIDICSKCFGTNFEDSIRNDRTDIYNLICSITAHDKQQHKYVDD